MLKRMTSLILALALVITMLPVTAFAEETESTETAVEETVAAETTVPVEETTEPAETATEATEGTTAPTEETTEPTEGTTAPTEETTEPTEGTTVPTEEETVSNEAVLSDTGVTSGTCGDSTTWTYLDGVVTISGSGSTSSTPWLSDYRYSITTVIVEEGITHLYQGSFSGCTKVTSVSLPDTLQAIESSCFSSCYKLESITLPQGLLSIGDNAFSSCISLKEITIPASVETIGKIALSSCDSLENIYVAEGNSCYSDVDGVLYSVDRKKLLVYPSGRSGACTIESTTEALAEYAFHECMLTAVTIPNSITEIPKDCFSNCTALAAVSLPDSLTSIGASAFTDCDSLTSIDIPDGVTEIGSHAFSYSGLESIVIPEGVTVLDDTFCFCTSLSQVTLPSTLKELKGSVFYFCLALKSLYLPEGITTIPYMSFSDTGLEEITIPDTVTDIDIWSFASSDSLERVSIGGNVQSIGGSAFYCAALNTIEFTGNAPTIADTAFSGVTATAYYPEDNATWTADVMQDYGGSLTWVAGEAPPANKNLQWAFDESTGTLTVSVLEPGPMDNYVMSTVPWKKHREAVKSVVIQEGVTSIGSMAFCNFPELTTVSIPTTVTTIGADAFSYCSQLTSAVIPSAVTEIGKKAFYKCWQLAELTLSEGLEQIGDEAFQGCKALTSLTLPEGLLTIGVNAFAECAGLETVMIPASVTHIEDGAFGSCDALQAFSVAENGVGYSAVDGILYDKDQTTLIQAPTAISGVCNVPKTVRNIQNKAFWRCLNLQELVFSDHITTIEPYAFYESTLRVCYPRGYVSWDDMKADYGGTITWVPIGLLGASGTLNYVSSGNGKKGELSFSYKDDWFYEDCTQWQPELARMSMRLSLAAAQTTSDDIEALYSELEFDNTTVWYPQPTPDTEGYIIGSRLMRAIDDDETFLLVAVTVRGGGYGAEVAQNFELGYGDEHSGYRYTADTLVSEVCKHIEATGVTDNIKIWITGFGRGGSVANIAAHRLNTYADESKISGLSRDNIYAYCFGNANVAKTDSTGYKVADDNIFNLTNPNDYTSYLAFTNWDYARYGTDYYLPTSMHMFTQYGEAYVKMQLGLVKMLIDAHNVNVKYDEETERLSASFGEFMPEIPLQGELLKTIAGDLSWALMDEFAYTRDNQDDIIAAFQHVTWDMSYAPAGFVLKLIFELLPDGPITQLVKKVKDAAGDALDCFSHAHWPELWVAWMDAIEDDTVLQLSLNTRYVSTNCPVDLSVYDSSGTLVAQFVNDVPQDIAGSTIRAYLDRNGQKIVVLPTDEEFRIETNATGDGTVSYQVQEYDIANAQVTRVIDYLDIPIQTGDQLTCTAGTGIAADYTVVDADNTEVNPDSERSGSEIVYCTLTVSADGSGTVVGGGQAVANSFAKVKAEAGADSLFAGWYLGEERVSADAEYRFRLVQDTALTAKFVSRDDCSIAMQEYIALQKGQHVNLDIQVCPDFLTEYVQWSTDNKTVIDVNSETGEITGLETGTAYVLATVFVEDVEITARCRVDVAETETVEEEEQIILDGVQLSTTKLTSELFSTDYAEFDVLLKLPQNMNFQSLDESVIPESNSVAIEEAYFTASTTKVAFDLVALDDRRVAVVPTEYAVEYPEELAKTYKSRVTIVVQGKEYTTEEELTLTLKQSKPKLKATIPAFNSFYDYQTQAIKVTGGTVTGITLNPDKTQPDWLTLNEDGTLSLNGNAAQKSGKVYLLVETEEWRIPAEITLTVKNARKAPGLKLSASSVKMAEDAASSSGVALKLLPKSKKDTLSSLNVTGITSQTAGYSVTGFDSETGTFILKAESGFRTGKVTLNVTFSDTSEVLPLTVKVSVQKVSLKLSARTVTLNKAIDDSAVVSITAAPADYILTAPTIEGNEDGVLGITYENGKLTIRPTDAAEAGKTYKLSISAGGSKKVTLSVKVIDAEPTLTLKAKGNIDLSFPDRAATITATFKNYASGAIKDYTTVVTAPDGTTSEDFTISRDGTVFTVTTTNTDIATGSYRLTLKLALPNGTELENTVKLTVKRTAVKLKLAPAKLTLNKTIADKASVAVSCTTKGYEFSEPVWQLMDKSGKNSAEGALDIAWSDGKLNIAVNDNTAYGATYKLLVKANAYAPAATLTITVPTEAKSAIKSSLKAKGTIDVIRAGTAVTITPGYKNCGTGTVGTEELLIYSSADKYAAPVNDLFYIEKDAQGRYILTAAEGLDHSKTYKAELVTTFGETKVTSARVALKVKMGSAKLTLTADGNILFANDKNSRVDFTLTAKDASLNEIQEVSIKADRKGYDQMLEVIPYGNGEFAIGFKDETVDRSLIGKTVTVTLNVKLAGNETAKVNATAKLRLTILK